MTRLLCRLGFCGQRPVAYFNDGRDRGTTYECRCGIKTDVLGDETGWKLGLYEREGEK